MAEQSSLNDVSFTLVLGNRLEFGFSLLDHRITVFKTSGNREMYRKIVTILKL